MNNIEDLPYVTERLRLAPGFHAGQLKAADQKRSEDKTAIVVFRWQDVRDELKKTRLASLEFLEVSRDEAGELAFSVVDEAGFVSNQTRISELLALKQKLEIVIAELAAVGVWYDDITKTLNGNDSVRITTKRRIGELQALYALRFPGMPLEDIQQLPDFVKKYSEYEKYLNNADKSDEYAKPILAKLKTLLNEVKC